LTAPAEAWLKSNPRLWRLLNRRKAAPDSAPTNTPLDPLPAHRAIVVGYGPIGRLVARILRDRGVSPVIIELNVDTFRRLRESGVEAVYGDAASPEVLEQAGVDKASSLILSASGSTANQEAVRVARSLNPDIHIVARADYLSDSQSLHNAGADDIFTGEGEVALAIAGNILHRLGATPEQVEEDRERIRIKLTGA
jgi:CPA2 family monovalent cation:H+ antiporter-2